MHNCKRQYMNFQLESLFSSQFFLLAIELCSFFLKIAFLVLIIIQAIKTKKIQKTWFYVVLIIIGALFSDASWIIYALRKIGILADTLHQSLMIIIRLAWCWSIIEFQSLSLFLESLVEKNNNVSNRQKIFSIISLTVSIFHIYFAVFEHTNLQRNNPLELFFIRLSSLYVFIPIFSSLYHATKRINYEKLPKIIKKQVNTLIKYFIAPHLISDFLQLYPLIYNKNIIISNYAVTAISSITLTLAFYFCSRKLMGLRFLNTRSHVQAPHSVNFINDFKKTLEHLAQTTMLSELDVLIQSFFKNTLTIQPSRTTFCVRNPKNIIINSTEGAIEQFVAKHENDSCPIAAYIQHNQVLIYDELAFNDFYDSSCTTTELLSFMNTINADIFLPIYHKNTAIAHIVIERDARANELYSNVERDEMVVFASYLANTIYLIQSNSIDALIKTEKELREELHCKHQEIAQYKESIRSFLRDTKQRKIGVIFYKNRKFTHGNQEAKDLAQLNINLQEGHPLTKALLKSAHYVQEYKTSYACFSKDITGNNLIISALPTLEHNNIIILIYYPEISDVIRNHIELLKDPTQSDYLLYLETTQSGKLIKQLIPGSGEVLTNFKIDLLKAALSKKALLLDTPEEDLIPFVELLHHISVRETLHVMDIQNAEKNNEFIIKIFGSNALLTGNQEPALLERLNNTGTLFIKNIHLLHLETQNYLAEFIKYGQYRLFKSTQKASANVRIIVSSTKDLSLLAREGKFSLELLNELQQTTLSMPPLFSLPENELSDLADALSEQAVQSQTFKNLLALNEKEKLKLINAHPNSLQEFRKKVLHMLTKKSKKNELTSEVYIDDSYGIGGDPDLIEAARLGKKALKNPKILAMLINKFKNQNKIALFLGVNRSSVHRRCKEYHLE